MANNFQVFGKNAVLTLEPVISRANTNTLNIEIAPLSNGKSIHSSKIIAQPTSKEIPLLTALFLGFLPAYRIQRADKWMTFLRQKEKGVVYIKSGGNGRVLGLPISAGDAYVVSNKILEALLLGSINQGNLVEVNIRSCAKLYMKESMKILQENTNNER